MPDNNIIKGFKINGTPYKEQNISDYVSHLTSIDGTDYILKVDNEGNLYTVKAGEEVEPISIGPEPTSEAATFGGESKLYINSVYCGGKNSDEHTQNYCDYNFVELSNLTPVDINLSPLAIFYADSSGADWIRQELHGVIKSGSTFVIRGAKCSSDNSPLTKIHVKKYDQEWKTDSGELIKFNDTACKFYLGYYKDNENNVHNPVDSSNRPINNPYAKVTTEEFFGYIDLVGFTNGQSSIDGNEGKSPYNHLSREHLMKKYYSMDKSGKATKVLAKRNNANDWNYIDLTKDDDEVVRNIEAYTPKASGEGKNLYYDKTDLNNEKPSILTCSFGINATDSYNQETGIGEKATRCFNWVTSIANQKYLWIRIKGAESWGDPLESFNANDNRTIYNSDKERLIYDSKIVEYTNHKSIVINKLIVNGLVSGIYEYVAGAKNSDGTPNMQHCTEIREFTVRKTSDCSNFSFIQTSDQQGFVWEEYRLWDAVCKLAEKESGSTIQFMINTGDMTQDGNRMYEWLDYFNGKNGFFNNMEEMATIGNNDLSENVLYADTLSDDSNKLWPENITLFYTFELDDNGLENLIVDISDKTFYIPSTYSFNYGSVHFMCVNSEIKTDAETSKNAYGFSHYGNIYPHIKEWCKNDIESYANSWNIAYCHEMPFTILTTGATKSDSSGNVTSRKINADSSMINLNMLQENERYWFSEFCQKNGIRLVMGGHKHTQSTTWPLLENVSYENGEVRNPDVKHPIIVVNSDELKDFDNATSLKEITVDGKIRKYPNSWFTGEIISGDKSNLTHLCEFMMLSDIPENEYPVVYAMSQASAYKHTSNKELPSKDTAWLRYHYGIEEGDSGPKEGQRYPFYTIWEITPTEIKGHVRALFGGFDNNGKFDINVQGKNLKRFKCSNDNSDGGHKGVFTAKGIENPQECDIFSINGLMPFEDVNDVLGDKCIVITK